METSLKTGFAQIFSCCPKNLSCPKFGGGAAAPLAPPTRTPMLRTKKDVIMEQIFARSTSSNSLISCQNRIMIFSSLISEYWLIWLIFEQHRISENALKYN